MNKKLMFFNGFNKLVAGALLLVVVLQSSCARVNTDMEPLIAAPKHPKQIQRETRSPISLPQDFSVSPFTPLTHEEAAQKWGQEFELALAFAKDFDLYRAITGFKRALYFLPKEDTKRRLEIEYDIALAYYLGEKYVEAVYMVRNSDLFKVDTSFPAFSDLLLILYDSYGYLDNICAQDHIYQLIHTDDPKVAGKLYILSALRDMDIDCLIEEGKKNSKRHYLESLMCQYCCEAKSIRKAQMLNAMLPGAGYWYVGQKETAVTALLINGLFIAAGSYFIHDGNIAAGVILFSLESGWYFGGISGAGLAARDYNECLYEKYARKITSQEQIFPSLMLRYSF